MRKMLNTLFVLTEDSYLALDNEAVIVLQEEKTLLRVPLLTLEMILYFGYKGASPALMGACADRGIRLAFITPNGHFLASVSGENKGNVLLRKEQYRRSEDEAASLTIARNCILGKVYNARWVLERTLRDHGARVDVPEMEKVSAAMKQSLGMIRNCTSADELRGFEGNAATAYFSVFDELILKQKETFFWKGRSRRPPMDCLNALLSFSYALLANDCAAGLESVGLDPYVGFLHRDRPGRKSLALDLMEELRAVYADRFVLSLVNTGAIRKDHFSTKENGAVLLDTDGKKIFLAAWQKRKQETITHPFLNEKVEWGLVPYVQSLLLARYLRGDLDEYPPFLWK